MVIMIKEKIEAAEAIRGVACLFVVFSHLSLTFFPSMHHFFDEPTTTVNYELLMHNSPFAVWYSGTAAVYIFFVLSGYVLTYTIVNSRDPIKKIKAMSIKRYPRLMLPALASCMLLWAAFSFYHPPMQHISSWGREIGHVPHLFDEGLTAFLFGDTHQYGALWTRCIALFGSFIAAGFDGSVRSFFLGYSDYNWVLWTMRIELLGSFGLFFLLYLRTKNPIFSWLIPIALIALCFNVDYLGYAAFLIGSLFYFHKKQLSNVVASVCLILGLYFAGVHNTSSAYKWFNDVLNDNAYEILNFLSGPLIVMSIMWNQKLAEAFSNRVTIYLGKLSFAAYLNHLLILFVVGLPLFQFLLELDWSYAVSAVVTCLTVVVLTIAFSEVFYQLVDKNTMKLSAKISDKFI
jgi:peptidoglycan/LPS O-acetylase OafA/YrhL